MSLGVAPNWGTNWGTATRGKWRPRNRRRLDRMRVKPAASKGRPSNGSAGFLAGVRSMVIQEDSNHPSLCQPVPHAMQVIFQSSVRIATSHATALFCRPNCVWSSACMPPGGCDFGPPRRIARDGSRSAVGGSHSHLRNGSPNGVAWTARGRVTRLSLVWPSPPSVAVGFPLVGAIKRDDCHHKRRLFRCTALSVLITTLAIAVRNTTTRGLL